MSFPDLIVADANRFVSALLGGFASRLLFEERFRFVTTERTTWEVRRYIPLISQKTRISEGDLDLVFQAYPFEVIEESEYLDSLPTSRQLIEQRDPRDVDILALMLHMNCPLWTHDKDFDSLPGVTVLRDDDLALLGDS